MAVTIGVHLMENSLSSAAIGLGLPPSTSKSGIIRAGLAIFAGKSKDEARSYAVSRESDLSTDGIVRATAEVPEELLNDARGQMSDSRMQAYAVRVGLAMAAGFSRKQAESFAKLPLGRPRKTTTE